MAHYYPKLLTVLSDKLCSPCGYIVMAGTVETVTADLILLIILIRKSVHICPLRHSLMECRIEYCSLWNSGHIFLTGIDSYEICRIVERRKCTELFYVLFHTLVYKYGFIEFLATMNHPVAYSVYLGKVRDHAVVLIYQRVYYQLNGYIVILHGSLDHNLVLAGRSVCQHASFYTDTLYKTFCQHVFGIGIYKLVFKRRASTVYNQYFHTMSLLYHVTHL